MNATVKDIVKILDDFARPELAEKWDNVGLLIGRVDKPVKKVIGALDFSPEVCEQAIAEGVDMIITHHPAILEPLKTITNENWQTEMILKIIAADIAVYSAHTNLDSVIGGVNDILARKLELEDIVSLEGEENPHEGIGRMGTLPKEISLKDYILTIKKALKIDSVSVVDGNRPVKKVIVCGGSGSFLIEKAIELGVDTLVTGDVKYHFGQTAAANGINLIDAGHQWTEMPIVNALADKLALKFTKEELDIKIIIAKESPIFKVL